MANIKTYDLLQCSRLYPTVEGANNVAFNPYIDLIAQINGDTQQTYTVKENVQARFFAPTSADLVSNVQYSVTSIVYNGLEAMNTVSNLVVEEVDNTHIDFPLYAMNPYLYTANLANGVYSETQALTAGYFEGNFATFMQGLFDTLGVPADITNSHDEWWVVDGFQSMRNFMIELYSSDTLAIELTETYNGVERVLRYEMTGTTATAFIDGNDVTTLPAPANELPQFGDVYSINSYSTTVDSILEVECCPVVDPFYASLQNNCCSTLDMNCDCTVISFSDTSNYENGLLGHDPSYFNHRTIILTKADGTEYIYSTDGVVGQPLAVCPGQTVTANARIVDEIINPHWSSNNMFSYTLNNGDIDGIYEVQICTFPDWQVGVYYDSSLNYIVYSDGVVYKQVSSSTGVDPATDTENVYWEILGEDDNRGRYCSTERIVVLCISIMKCYKSMVTDAMCSLKMNPCKSMCENISFMNAMKMRITLDALEFAVCAEQWDLAQEHIDILRNICCCNG